MQASFGRRCLLCNFRLKICLKVNNPRLFTLQSGHVGALCSESTCYCVSCASFTLLLLLLLLRLRLRLFLRLRLRCAALRCTCAAPAFAHLRICAVLHIVCWTARMIREK